jgi:hypothetical protein
LAVAALASAAAATAGTQATLPCASSQLAAKVGGTQGAAGTIAFSVVFTNVSRNRCSLGGYPALQMRNAKGKVRTRVTHGGLAFLVKPVRSIVVRPGGHATLLLAYSDVPHGTEKACPAATALVVRPAGAVAGITVKVSLAPCNRGLIYESPLLPGRVPVP